MSTPKARPKRKQAKKKVPDYTVGPIPDDAFGAAADAPPPPGPEAPPISIDTRFEYLLNNPDLYTAAASLPDASRVGRPAHYPSVVYLIFLCSISIFGSARSTACSLQRPLWWDQVLNAVRSHSGDEAAAALPATGPSRSQWNYYFQKRLKPAFAEIRDTSRDLWIQQALSCGMMAESGKRVSRAYPERQHVVHSDATVPKPASSQRHREVVNTETGEIRRHRVDPDASTTREGGGKIVYGNKFLSLAVRLAATPHSRIVLGIESVRHKSRARDPQRDDEGTAFVKLTKHILSQAPGLRAITYDTALRGTHRAPLIADGLIAFSTQHGGLTPQSLKQFEDKDTGCTHDLYVADGRICERHMTINGKTHYTPLPVEELAYRKGKETSRYYHRITIPCPSKKHTEHIRCDETDEDRQMDPRTKRQRFHRTEHLRQVPPDTPAGRRLRGFRQDSESQHSRLDQAYALGRMPAYGAIGSLLIYVGFAWVSNSVTRAVIGTRQTA
ncbi:MULTISPECIES: hypothetical protein [unclassified Streptomyces]|uniref:hypothetical protein n=1 Tax=unclassified Streptomyces TaxID=2593676 RepID=UPI0020CA7967|nr:MULTISPECIES: hypothetical protein [unclassified Streptomyces]